MKIRKNDARHWGYLALSAANVLAGGLARVRRGRDSRIRVGLYGHTFNGNLKALADAARERDDVGFFFVTMDPDYAKRLESDPNETITVLNLLKPRDAARAASVDVIVTDRQAQTYELLKWTTSIPFIDVWHGVPFKGFTERSFRYLRRYREVWTSSPSLSQIYAEKFGAPASKLIATGYARADLLVHAEHSTETLRERYDIPSSHARIALIAPTWAQDERGRSIFPFGTTKETFYSAMDKVGRETDTLFIFRAHLNVEEATSAPELDHVRDMPYSQFPVVEDFLAMSDLLVTDWSSMAFDFLPLNRPTIFLDVPAPFKDGFTLGPEHRFGDIATDLESLVDYLKRNLIDPVSFRTRNAASIDATMKVAYGDTLDGQVALRQLDRLQKFRVG